ncbi:MAG TPA: DNA gyrase inhibitor YacG [Noviherbaspirillum sp.]|nr:DNA gyrase inhibitor YacG [Noviherbaspirillum sp.]
MPVVVSCPTCGNKVEWIEANKYRPFCSDRCKQIDLGAWAEGKYAIPATEPPKDDEHGER